jgi:hypothetical protein
VARDPTLVLSGSHLGYKFLVVRETDRLSLIVVRVIRRLLSPSREPRYTGQCLDKARVAMACIYR